MLLVKGERFNLSQNHLLRFQSIIEWDCGDCEIDSTIFLLKDNKASDENVIFFNNPIAIGHSIVLESRKNITSIDFNLSLIPNEIDKIVITLTLDSTQGSAKNFGDISNLKFSILDDSYPLRYESEPFSKETAITLIQIYKKNNIWRLNPVGTGFIAGLDKIMEGFGIEIIEEKSVPKDIINLEKKILEEKPRLINLLKPINICLKKNKLEALKAEVVFVLDASGSMRKQFIEGNVQEILERLTLLAMQFDDDNALELWAFGKEFKQFESVQFSNLDDYIERLVAGDKKRGEIIPSLGGTNNEPPIIKALSEKYQNTSLPTYIIFISDGGISQNKKIKELINKASHYAIFWQFVGLGGNNYGVLEKLDTMENRFVDNANFFAIDDFKNISDEALYDLLLSEFPLWLEEIKGKGMLKDV